MVKYSIIIPCYKAETYIASILRTYGDSERKDFEVILVDDCSPDATYPLLQEKTRNFTHIRVLQTDKNGGPGLARNKGLEFATGEYILFNDCDDDVDLSVLERIDELLIDKKEVDLIVMPFQISRNGKAELVDYYTKCKNGERVPVELIVQDAGGPVARVYKKEIIEKYSLEFPPRLTGEDKCFVIRYLVHAENIYKLDYVYYTYIMNKQSITHQSGVKVENVPTTFEILQDVYEKYFPECLEKMFADTHLLTSAKIMFKQKRTLKEIKKFFRRENKRYPNWIQKVEYDKQSLYRKLIYKAMYKNRPICIKLIMWLRAKLY